MGNEKNVMLCNYVNEKMFFFFNSFMSHGYYEMTQLEEKKSYQKRTAMKCIKAK